MIQWQRWQGTLELGAAAPPSMAIVYLPFSLANSFTGMYALVATLLWGRVLFGVPLHFVHPWLFVLVAARDRCGARPDGARARVDVHPLPLRERALEPARVPGLDRVRPRSSRRRSARLDAPDLVGAAALLGHASRSGMPRSAATCGGRSRWSRCSGSPRLAIGALTFRAVRARRRARGRRSSLT